MLQHGDTLADAASLNGDREGTETAFCGDDEDRIVRHGGGSQGWVSSFEEVLT